jgi:hypothetical protein
MSDAEGFQGRLEAALEQKRSFIEEQHLPRLQKAFQLFQTLVENLCHVLIRKSLIQEDPYKYDQKLSEISVPSREPFPESERREKLGQRLSEYQAQLELLNTTYRFTLEFLTLERLKRMIGLAQYVDWQNLSESSQDSTTAALARALAPVRLGTDSMSTGILSSSTTQLRSLVRDLGTLLRGVTDCQRETYKLQLRRSLFPQAASVLPRLYDSAPEKALQRLRELFPRTVRGVPFYRELVRELLEEEFGKEREAKRREALARLAIPAEEHSAPPPPDFRPVLRDGVRQLLAAGRTLADARQKLEENRAVLEGRARGLRDRLRAWWARTRGRSPAGRVVEVQYFDSAKGTMAGESLDLPVFLEGLQRKAALFSALASSAHPSARRLETAGEKALYEFLNRNLRELQLIHRRLKGLDEYFKKAASAQERSRIKGFRIEGSALKNCIVGANKRRYEYAARREEQEQLVRLKDGQSDGMPPERQASAD